MAPGCLLAGRRILSMSFVLYLLVWAIWWSVLETTAVLTYNRQALFYSRLSSADCCGRIPIEYHFFNSQASSIFPVISCYSMGCCLHRKKRARKRGKRSGLLIRLKRCGASLPRIIRAWPGSYWLPKHNRDSESQSTGLVPVFSDSLTPFRRLSRQHGVKRGVDIRNLRTLEYVKPPAVLTDTGPRLVKLSLVNASVHYNNIYEALVASNDKKFTIQSLVINNFKHLLISEHAYLVIMNMIEMHKASFVLCSPGEPTLQTKLQPVPTSKISMSCFHGHQWIQNSLLVINAGGIVMFHLLSQHLQLLGQLLYQW